MMRAIIYARVSTRGQAEEGYSLRDQIRALREYCQYHGYQIVEEVEDQASGASLDRPGFNTVTDLVAAGGIDIVLAQDRDRFARDDDLLGWLRVHFKQYGTKLQALNDPEGDSPTDEFTVGIMEQVSKLERAMIAIRTRRGKHQRAREGKIVPTGSVPLGFRYVNDRYEVDESSMWIVRRIFEMAAAGHSVYRIRQTLNSEGIRTPRDGRFWSPNTLRRIISHDIYRPHSPDEIKALGCSAELSPNESYGVFRYGDIIVPVINSGLGISQETVDAARQNLSRVKRPPRADNRFWELHGHAFCSCGAMMLARVVYPRGKAFHYYVCSHYLRDGRKRCPEGKWINAGKLEHEVYTALQNIKPQDLQAQIQRLIDSQRAPEQEIKAAHEIIQTVALERDRLVRLYTTGRLDDTQYDTHAAELQSREDTARRQLERLQTTNDRVERLKLMKRNPILRFVGQTKEMRRDYYRDIELTVVADRNGVVMRGIFGSHNITSIQTNGTTKAKKLFLQSRGSREPGGGTPRVQMTSA